MVDILQTAKLIAEVINETNCLAKRAQLITVAQHLGKTDVLEKMLASFSD